MYRGDTVQWETLIEHLDLHGDELVLDVGTAVGEFPLTLARRAGFQGHITAVDWSPHMITQARHIAQTHYLHNQVDFRIVDLNDGLPFPNAVFDIVTCIGVLETIPHPSAAMAELGRVLKPNGLLIISTYLLPSKRDQVQAWYLDKLANIGFKKRAVLPFRRDHDLMIVTRRNKEDIDSN